MDNATLLTFMPFLDFTAIPLWLLTAFILDFTFAWLLWIFFQYLAISEMRKVSLREGLADSIKADTLSLSAFEIGLFG